ncbi:MAG: hypothetical protein KAY37_13620 [Phycisphaerae bacterium]|nr:hypothetical protein [Phycisphaerae bacterium]
MKRIMYTVAATFVASLVPWVSADFIRGVEFDYDWSEPEQENEACGHIALINILDHWDAQFSALVPPVLEPNVGENEADALSAELQKSEWLGPGPTTDNWTMWNTVESWFSDKEIGLRRAQEGLYEGEKPTWSFLKSEIELGEKILMLITWGPEPATQGHWLSVFGKNDSPRQCSVHDPNFSGANEQTYNFSEPGDGYLHIPYNGEDAKVTQFISVTAIPEPGTAVLVLFAALGLTLRRPDLCLSGRRA